MSPGGSPKPVGVGRTQIIGAALAGLLDQRHDRAATAHAVIRRTGCLLVREGRAEMVGRQAGPFRRLAVIVGGGHRHARGGGRHLLLGQADTPQVAEERLLHRMAGRAHVPIDLKTALGRSAIEGAERPVEAPVLVGIGDHLVSGESRRHRQRATEQRTTEEKGRKGGKAAHHAFSIGFATAPPGSGPPPSTGRLMLSGSGSGRSSLPSTGRITRKCRK